MPRTVSLGLMLRKPLFKEMFGVLVLIAFLHITGMNYFWYWKFFWFDILTHFLGGLWVGLAVLWLGNYLLEDWKLNKRQTMFFVLCAVVFIGISWEVFEYVNGITVANKKGYWSDTYLDIIMDLIGGVLAGLYGWRMLKKTEVVLTDNTIKYE